MTPNVAAVQAMAAPFSRALYELGSGYNSLPSELQAKRAAWTGAMAQLVRKYHDLVFPKYAGFLASEAALAEARERGLDLYAMTWRQQEKHDPKRRVFHLEHVVTVSAVVSRCFTDTEEQIFDLIAGESLQLAWILKKEDKRLNELGVRSLRPDPMESYRQAGIVLVRHSDSSRTRPV
jgi:hypothetical protein